MTDVDSSPRDPVFYLHHNYVDRLYWQWQQINATERLHLVSGNTTITESADGWKAMTLDYEMNMYGIVDNVTIGDVTNIQGGYLCYEFEY
jgi:tyrosinase